MENRLTTRREGAALGSNLLRVGGVAEDNDNEHEKVYYGFGVFMGLRLADLRAIKDEFMEQQALTSGPPRRALPLSAVMDEQTHRAEDEEGVYESQEDVRMASPRSHQQQLHQPHLPSRSNGSERLHGESQSHELGDERDRYRQERPNVERDEGGDNSDTSDEVGQKSHSLNFILH